MPRHTVDLSRSPVLVGLSLLTAGVLALAGVAFLSGHAAAHAPTPLRVTVGVVLMLFAVYRAVVTLSPRGR